MLRKESFPAGSTSTDCRQPCIRPIYLPRTLSLHRPCRKCYRDDLFKHILVPFSHRLTTTKIRTHSLNLKLLEKYSSLSPSVILKVDLPADSNLAQFSVREVAHELLSRFPSFFLLFDKIMARTLRKFHLPCFAII
jgi:hypothetical protein